MGETVAEAGGYTLKRVVSCTAPNPGLPVLEERVSIPLPMPDPAAKPTRISESLRASLNWVQAEEGTSLARFPDFFILGPQRTGSTWLFHHLQSHPDLFLPWEKEIYFFNTVEEPEKNRKGLRTLEDYLGRMQDPPLRTLRKHLRCMTRHRCLYRPALLGEATASYATLSPKVIADMLTLNPALKGFLFLRDPVDRAWSHAKKDLIDRHNSPVDEISDDEFARFFRTAGQKKKSRYQAMIDQWSEALPEKHLFVGNFETIASNPAAILRASLDFLGVRLEDRFLNLETLNQRVNPTSGIPIPDRVRTLMEEIQAGEIEDYAETFRRLEPHRLAEGSWCL